MTYVMRRDDQADGLPEAVAKQSLDEEFVRFDANGKEVRRYQRFEVSVDGHNEERLKYLVSANYDGIAPSRPNCSEGLL